VSVRKDDLDFARLLKSAGALSLARQLGGLAFMASVLVLPAIASRPVVDDFIWAYFASLFLSSILNLGLERVVGPLVAGNEATPLQTVLRPVLVARLYSAPVTVAALWILYRFVDVHLPLAGWAFSLTWVLAIQVQGVAFAGLRAGGRRQVEPHHALLSRLVETALLIGLATAGAPISLLIGAMATVEVAVAVAAVRSLGRPFGPSEVELAPLPWRTMSVYALIEFLAFAYLRLDVALVGNILGPGPGATYGLIYRVIDALTGLSTPVILLLFPYAAKLVSGGTGLRDVRERALRLLPAAAVVLSVAGLVLAAPLAAAVPRFGEGLPALRILLVAVPLSFMNALELHFRSAEGRNGEVLAVAAAVLAVNVVLNLYLIPRHGLDGAAWALCLTEAFQLGAIMVPCPAGHDAVRRWGGRALGYAATFALLALLVNAGQVLPGVVVGAALVMAAGIGAVRPHRPRRPLALSA
jgi:O-antigen/teichoic acid export membrane protein